MAVEVLLLNLLFGGTRTKHLIEAGQGFGFDYDDPSVNLFLVEFV